MKSSNAIVILLSAIIFFGCNPLKKMIKLAEEKQKIIETIKIEDKINFFEKILSFSILDKSKNKTIQ